MRSYCAEATCCHVEQIVSLDVVFGDQTRKNESTVGVSTLTKDSMQYFLNLFGGTAFFAATDS